jgi:transposase
MRATWAPRASRLRTKRANKATVAVAHSILVIAYHMLQRRQPYNELGGDYFLEPHRVRLRR